MSETVKPTVLSADDIIGLVPKLASHRKLVETVMHIFAIDKVNDIHSRLCDTPGPDFVRRILSSEGFDRKLIIRNEEVLDHLPEGAFVTVSNHPLGALDGIALIHIIASRRPDYKVMVNMILNQISAMRPNFIAVDALASDDPKKRSVSMAGIREVIKNVRGGHPVGFFPAGAISKIDIHGRLNDREWQPSVVRLIEQLKVPVIPIYFHESNSAWFNFLGRVSWQLRTLRLPAEVFRNQGKPFRISVGNPISVEEQKLHQGSVEEFGQFLKSKTYEMRSWRP